MNPKWPASLIRMTIVGLSLYLLGHYSPLAQAQDSSPPVTTISINGTVGQNSWYVTTVNVTLTATDPDSGVASTEYWVDSNAHNVVTYLSGAPTQVQFNVSSPGTHVVYFFSTNKDGAIEAQQSSASFKIDTAAPGNWRNFSATQAGNDHTFILDITVDDTPAGLNPATAYYNYSTDGVNFGYHSTTTNCSSSFIAEDPNLDPPEAGSGWKQISSVSPNSDGTTTITLTTQALDFCNSSWNLNEAVQFYITDMAGNESFKVQILFGSWIKTEGGDLHSQGPISFGADSEADYLVSSNTSPINNLNSAASWYTVPYNLAAINTGYSALYAKLGSPTTGLPSGRLPTVKGLYWVNGDFTIDSGTIPSGLSNAQNFGAVIFISGRLTINDNFSLHPSSSLVFVVDTDLRTRRSVNTAHGFFIVDNDIDFSYDGNNSQQFVLTGGVVGNGTWEFGKNLGGSSNVGTPAERFVFNPRLLDNKDIVGYLSTGPGYQWNEVAP